MLKAIEKFLGFFYKNSINYPRLTLSFYVLILLLLVSQIPKLKIGLSTEEIIEKDTIIYHRLMALKKDFFHQNTLLLYFKLKDDKVKNFCELNSIVKRVSFDFIDVNTLTSPFTLRTVNATPNRISYPTLIKLNCDNAEGVADFSFLKGTPWDNLYRGKMNDLSFEIYFRDTPGGSKYGAFDPNIVKEYIQKLNLELNNVGDKIETYFLGSLGFFYYAYIGNKFTQVLNLVIVLVLIILFRLFYGTYRSSFLLIISLIFTGAFIYGGLAIYGIKLNFLNTGIFLIVAISSLEDFVFISSEQLITRDNNHEIFESLIVPSFFTSLTTAIGFGSLYFTEISVVKEFGLWCGLGAMLEWLMTFSLIPALICIFPKYFNVWTESNKIILRPTVRKVINYNIPRKISYVFFIFFITGILVLPFLRVSESAFELFPKSHPIRVGIDKLKESRGWIVPVDVVFSDFNKREINQKIIEELKKDETVVSIENPYEIIDFHTKNLTQVDKNYVLSDMKTLDAYKRLISENGKMRAILYIRKNILEDTNRLVKKINELCKDSLCYPTGEVVAYADFSNKVPISLMESLFMSMLLVTIILLILAKLKKYKDWLIIILSSLWGPFVLLTALLVFNIPINFLSCVFASVLVGLTGDNAIQYMFASKENELREGIVRRADGSIRMFIIMFLGSMVFLFSYYAPSRTLGLLLGGGLFASLVGDLFLLKAWLKK